MTLNAHLLQRDRAPSDEQALTQLLARAWCWPRQPGLQVRARALVSAPAPLEPGETLLLTANEHQGGLWRLVPGAAGPVCAELGQDCRQQLQRLQQQVSRDLPFVCHVDGFSSWSVEPLHVHQQTLLSGPSFGLAFALATASRMLGLALPTECVACAVLNDQGRAEPVEAAGLKAKLGALRDWAPGVTRVLVARAQLRQAQAMCTELDAPLLIEPIADLGEAIQRCLGDAVQQLQSRWLDREVCARMLQRLFLQLVDGNTPLLHFESVARGAALLAQVFPEHSHEFTQAKWIEVVARGHDGAEDALPLHREWLESMRRPLRLRALAHAIGRAVYAEERERRAIIDYATSQLASTPQDDHPDDLRVLGALGRHAAMLGDYELARAWLSRAVQGWHELAAWGSGAYALCELIRIAGVTRDRSTLQQALVGPAQAALSSGTLDHTSLCFVTFAAGRAWAQLEEWASALTWLGEGCAPCPGLDWTRTPAHLAASRARWAWLAATHTGDPGAAHWDAALEDLAQVPDARFVLRLQRIDKLAFTHEPTATNLDAEALRRELDAFQGIEPRAYALACTLAESTDAVAQARALRRHYPY